MSNKDSGGPAFPSHGSMGEVVCDGMTLREYFAAKAMQGMLCNGFVPAMGQDNYEDFNYVKIAYRMADAMLAERIK